jgi:hypothetical protein
MAARSAVQLARLKKLSPGRWASRFCPTDEDNRKLPLDIKYRELRLHRHLNRRGIIVAIIVNWVKIKQQEINNFFG